MNKKFLIGLIVALISILSACISPNKMVLEKQQLTGNNLLVYIHIPSEKRRTEAKRLQQVLKSRGYVVSSIQNTGANSLKVNEIRYFYPFQEEQARRILEIIQDSRANESSSIIKYLKGYEGKAKYDTLEFWYVK
jgi:hypothetical protein